MANDNTICHSGKQAEIRPIADLDIGQGTSFNWQARRLQRGLEPAVAVERFGTVDQALKHADHFDLMILDGPPHSTAGTLRIAEKANLVVLPTGLALDDMEPSVLLLAHELVKKGIPKARIAFALCRVGDSEPEIVEAHDYIAQAGYRVLGGAVPEKTAYRRASDDGRTLTETRFSSLNDRGDALAQSVIDLVTKLRKGRAKEDMARVPRPKNSRKGAPPPAARAIDNLDKPEPAAIVPFNFKVPADFKREFKVYAAQRGKSMVEILQEAFLALRDQRG